MRSKAASRLAVSEAMAAGSAGRKWVDALKMLVVSKEEKGREGDAMAAMCCGSGY
jgi:hypothetical protein